MDKFSDKTKDISKAVYRRRIAMLSLLGVAVAGIIIVGTISGEALVSYDIRTRVWILLAGAIIFLIAIRLVDNRLLKCPNCGTRMSIRSDRDGAPVLWIVAPRGSGVAICRNCGYKEAKLE